LHEGRRNRANASDLYFSATTVIGGLHCVERPFHNSRSRECAIQPTPHVLRYGQKLGKQPNATDWFGMLLSHKWRASAEDKRSKVANVIPSQKRRAPGQSRRRCRRPSRLGEGCPPSSPYCRKTGRDNYVAYQVMGEGPRRLMVPHVRHAVTSNALGQKTRLTTDRLTPPCAVANKPSSDARQGVDYRRCKAVGSKPFIMPRE